MTIDRFNFPVAHAADGTHRDRLGTVWVPVYGMYQGTCPASSFGDFHGYRPSAAGEYFKFNFCVPSNFKNLSKAVLVYIANGNQAGGTNGLDIDTDYGKAGEAYNNHSGAIAGADAGAVVDTIIYEVDLSAALANIEAGDYVGVKVTVAAGGSPGNRVIVGFKLEYDETG